MGHGRCRRCGGRGWIQTSFGKKKVRCPGDYATPESGPYIPDAETISHLRPTFIEYPTAGNYTDWGTLYEYYAEGNVIKKRRLGGPKPSSTAVDGIQPEPLNFANFGHLERGDTGWTTVVDEKTGATRIKSVVDSGPGYFEAIVSGDDQKLHCTDGRPAYQYYDEEKGGVVKFWFKDGYLESMNDNPAISMPDGTKEWRRKGTLHRSNGEPAILGPNGEEYYYKNGRLFMISEPDGDTRSYGGQPPVLHRGDGGPAIMREDGHREWWIKGRKHRLDGPAVIRADGTKEWWVNGKRVSRLRFLLTTKASPFMRNGALKSILMPKGVKENEEPPFPVLSR